MTNLELDHRGLTRRTQQPLADTRATREAAMPCQVPGPDRLVGLLNACDAVGTPRNQTIQGRTLRTMARRPVALCRRARCMVKGGGSPAAG